MPVYNALSYTWGDAYQTVPILIDEKFEFLATSNLEAGLRHLRQKDEIVTMWIDAICINQYDIPEKNVQLAQMREIYVQAKSVIAWLGPPGDDSNVAMRWIQEYGERSYELNVGGVGGPRLISLLDTLDASSIDEAADIKAVRIAYDLREQLSPDNPIRANIMDSLLAFFNRPYWKRVWIVQELASASRLFFICGEQTATDNAMYDALRLLRNFAQYQNLKRSHTAEEKHLARKKDECLMSIKWTGPINMLKFRRAKHAAPLIHIMRTFKNFAASDPRDKVFALLGISRDAEVLGLRADYSRTCEQVYTDATRRLIHAGYMDILSLVRFPKKVKGLQSWVPDFSKTSYRVMLQERSLERNGPPGSTRLEPRFFASASKEKILLRRENTMGPGMSMNLSGVRVGTVEHVGTHWSDERGVGGWLQELKNLSFLVLCVPDSAKHGPEAIWRAAVADQEIRQGVRKPRLADEKVHIALEAFKNADLRGIGEKELADVGLSYYCEWLQAVAKDRRPFLMQGGHLGIGPNKTKPGDIVVVLLGSDLPFIMRQDSDDSRGLRMVGVAYVHGIMDGEVMEHEPVIEIIELC